MATRLFVESDLGTQLKVWLDGNDSTTISPAPTGSPGTSTAQIWADKSVSSGANSGGAATNATSGAVAWAANKWPPNSTGGFQFAGATQFSFAYNPGNSFSLFWTSSALMSGSGQIIGGDDGGLDVSFSSGNLVVERAGQARLITSTPTAGYHVYRLDCSASGMALYEDGTQIGSFSGSSGLTAGIVRLFNCRPQFNNPFTGYAGDVVFCSLLSTADAQKEQANLAWKRGIQGQLPANDPYAAAAPTVTTADPITARRRPLILMAS